MYQNKQVSKEGGQSQGNYLTTQTQPHSKEINNQTKLSYHFNKSLALKGERKGISES